MKRVQSSKPTRQYHFPVDFYQNYQYMNATDSQNYLINTRLPRKGRVQKVCSLSGYLEVSKRTLHTYLAVFVFIIFVSRDSTEQKRLLWKCTLHNSYLVEVVSMKCGYFLVSCQVSHYSSFCMPPICSVAKALSEGKVQH